MAINKDEFIAAIAAQAKVPTAQAEAVLEAIADVTARQLAVDGIVRVPGLANFEAKRCAARPGRNLRTDEPCVIPAATRVRIRPSAPLNTKFKAAQAAQE